MTSMIFFKDPIRLAAGLHRAFGLFDGLNGRLHLPALFLQKPALHLESCRQIQVNAIEQILDFPERYPDELEGHNLLKTGKVPFAIQPMACARTTAGFKQPQTVVVVQRANSHPGFLSKLAYPVHGNSSPDHPEV